MKNRIILSIALVLSVVLVTLTGSDSKVGAQNQIKVVADSGVVTLGPNQILRVTVVGALDLNDLYVFRINKQSYEQNTCSGANCKLAVASQNTTDPITLMPGEAASIDIPNTAFGVRGVILSNNQKGRVTAVVFDTSTQCVIGAMEMYDL
jgi:hypothetical protein